MSRRHSFAIGFAIAAAWTLAILIAPEPPWPRVAIEVHR